MGIEPYLLASTLNLVVAQRLVRRLCDRCKEPIKLGDDVLEYLKIDGERAKSGVFYHGRGCKSCEQTGYQGRLPIFEFLVVDNDIREMLTHGVLESEIRAAARKKNYGGLLESGVGKIFEGLTTAEEVLRVAFTENVRS